MALINGGAVNTAPINGVYWAGDQTVSIESVRFSRPRLALHLPAFGSPVTTFGEPRLAIPRPGSIRPVSFGIPRTGLQATPVIQGAGFGSPQLILKFYPESLEPVAFSTPAVKFGTDLWCRPESLPRTVFGRHVLVYGMPPPERTFPATGFAPVMFGRPSARRAFTTDRPQSLVPTTFGRPALGLSLAPTSLTPTIWGLARTATAYRQASFAHAVVFGTPASGVSLRAKPLQGVRFGSVRVLLGGVGLRPASLYPVTSFGVPDGRHQGLRTHPICTTRFGVHVIDRGQAC